MTAHDSHLNHQDSVIGAMPYDTDFMQTGPVDWPQMTDVVDYSVYLIGGKLDFVTAFSPLEETTISLPSLSTVHRLAIKLTALQDTPEHERWPGSIWPSAQAFKDAELFIQRSSLNLIPTPEIKLANDGEINFLWTDGDVHVDLGFYGTGAFSYFARGGDGQRLHGECTAASDGLPREIIELFLA